LFPVAAAVVGAFALGAAADVRLPAVFTDHAVLQQGIPVPVWGWAEPGETVTVTFAGQTKTAAAGPDGRWMVRLEPLKSGAAPRDLVVAGRSARVTVKDVLVGEVWICSGQSNMERQVRAAANGLEETQAADYPEMRLFTVAREPAEEPRRDCRGHWVACEPLTAGRFSAVGYFFGRHLHRELKVPVGLIANAWSGMAIEPYIPRSALESLPPMAQYFDGLKPHAADYLAKREELERVYEQGVRKYGADWAAYLKAIDDQDAGLAGRWQDPATDVSGWATLEAPGAWETGALPRFDGVVWLRRDVEVPASWAGRDLLLELGPADDVDTTWFNGDKVGGLGYEDAWAWTVPRRYPVAGRLVRAGRAAIVVRITDLHGEGGLVGLDRQMRLGPAPDGKGEAIPLAGPWKYKVGWTARQRPPRQPAPPAHPAARGPASLYNGMVHPLAPYGIAGAIWYQGESNAGRPAEYRALLPMLIKSWRAAWGQGDFPFLIVQLPNLGRPPAQPAEGGWAWLREAQLMALSEPKTGLAVTIDVGDAGNLHPPNKQDVGLRLALAALHVTYGRDLVFSGPIYDSMNVEGSKIRLRFRQTDGGLEARGGPLKQFAVAGQDRRFVWAEARIEGETVLVSSDAVTEPVAVRYAWADNPAGCNLYNKEGLPASPFRTDRWPHRSEVAAAAPPASAP
jgi:sialate O-acetylesterase